MYRVIPILIEVPKGSGKFGQLWAECSPALDATTARAHRAVDQVGHTRLIEDLIFVYPPFEVAKPEEIFDFYRQRGFVLCQLRTDGGLGNNQFVFEQLSRIVERP